MYCGEDVKNRITNLCKIKGVTVKKMLSDLELSASTVQKIGDNMGIASISLARIADYLECSMDYLMCRTNTQQINISTGDIVGSNINSHGSTASTGESYSSEDKEILKMLKGLSAVQRAKIIIKIDEIINGG